MSILYTLLSLECCANETFIKSVAALVLISYQDEVLKTSLYTSSKSSYVPYQCTLE